MVASDTATTIVIGTGTTDGNRSTVHRAPALLPGLWCLRFVRKAHTPHGYRSGYVIPIICGSTIAAR